MLLNRSWALASRFGPLDAVIDRSPPSNAADAEDIVAQHMVAEALLAAHLVAIAGKAGMDRTGRA
jgi:hypothetical protein